MAIAYARKRTPLDPCPIERVVALVGGKWKARALYLLHMRAFGFAELRRTLGGVSQQVLSTQLREMEREGLVRRVGPARAGAVGRYEATSKGRELVGALTPAAEWGTRELFADGRAWRPPAVEEGRQPKAN